VIAALIGQVLWGVRWWGGGVEGVDDEGAEGEGEGEGVAANSEGLGRVRPPAGPMR
jgi:hypothetical protein